MGISFIFSFTFHSCSQLFVRPPQTIILPFCISFSLGWFWSLPPVQCYEPPSIVLHALCLSDLIPWIYLSLHCIIIGIWFRSYLNGLVSFPAFFSLAWLHKELMIWAIVSSRSCFCWLYRAASPSSAAKNIINLMLVLTIWWCVELSLVLLEEGACYDQCFLLAKLC